MQEEETPEPETVASDEVKSEQLTGVQHFQFLLFCGRGICLVLDLK